MIDAILKATAMPSLIITVFVLQLVIYTVNTVGASTLNELVRSHHAALINH